MKGGAHYLVVDFGTTSTKSALVDLDTGVFAHLRRHSALPVRTPVRGRHEVSLTAIRDRFEAICGDAWAAAPFSGIVLCSEMHGFALLDADTGAPLTDYVSWLDARALEVVDGASTVDRVRQHLPDTEFRRLSGMRPRPGFPLLNTIHCGRTRGAGGPDLPARVSLVSLPGWLALSATADAAAGAAADPGAPPPEHPTMLAAMALYDVVAGRHAPELLACVAELGGLDLRLGEPAAADAVAGRWTAPDGTAVPIHVGVGDHQASVLGAGVTGPEVASVNLGTGSQVSLVDGPLDNLDLVEHRPFFDGRHLAAVTHIPAGRALNEFVGFLERVAGWARSSGGPEPAPGGEAPDVWGALAALTDVDVAAAPLEVDLAVFDGARGFAGGGRIGGIVEGALTPEGYLASVLAAFAGQYAAVLDQLDPARRVPRIALSGGIARNLPHLAAIEARLSGRQVEGAVELDESLLGLRALALRAAGHEATVAAAQTRFGRACRVQEEER